MIPATKGIDTLVVTDFFQKEDIIDFGALYHDAQAIVDFPKIKSLPDTSFVPLRQTGIYIPAMQSIHWIKSYLKNDSNSDIELILQVHNPRINKVQLIICHADETEEHSDIIGDVFPFNKRSIKHRDFLFPLRLPANSTSSIYVIVDNYGEAIDLLSTLSEASFFEREDKRYAFLFASIIGFSISIFLLSLVFTAMTRRRLLVYFSLYYLSVVFLLLAQSGYGFQYIWGEFPVFNDGSGYFFVCTTLILLLALARRYMSTKQLLPRTDLFMKILQWILAVYSIYPFSNHHFHETVNLMLINIGMIVILISLFTIVYTCLEAYRRKRNLDFILFLFGFTFVLLIGLVHVFENFDLIELDIPLFMRLSIAFAIDILFLSFVISNQIRKDLLKNYELSNPVSTLKAEAANALFEGQQEERKRLSVELHDGIRLRMATIKMRLSNLLNGLTSESNKSEVNELLDQMGTVSEQIRNFTHALMPLDLNEISLLEAIEDMIYIIEQAKPDLQVSLDIRALGETCSFRSDFEPNDIAFAWGAGVQGADDQSGVFIYFVKVQYVDGKTEVFKGDVLLVR